MNLSVGEILQQIQKCETFEEKKKILLKNNTPGLRTYLRMAFDGSVKMLLPDSIPEINEPNVPQGLGETSLLVEAKKMYIFLEVDGNPSHPKLSPLKRESKFIGLLVSIDNLEREYLKQIKQKTLDIGLSFDEINKIIPGLLRKENEKEKKLGNESESSSTDGGNSGDSSSGGLEKEKIEKAPKQTKPKKPKKPRKTKEQKEKEKAAKEEKKKQKESEKTSKEDS